MEPANRPKISETTERDAARVADALSGDSEAFGELVQAYERRAFSTAYRLLNNTDDARDVVQDAFVRAYRSLGGLKDPRRFGPWLLRIVTNLSLNARRARGTTATVSLDERQGTDISSGLGEPAMKSPGPQRRAEGRELQTVLDRALEQLPEKQRLILMLFTVEGLAQKDIAEVMDCTVEAVKWNVFQARKRLRKLLDDEGV